LNSSIKDPPLVNRRQQRVHLNRHRSISVLIYLRVCTGFPDAFPSSTSTLLRVPLISMLQSSGKRAASSPLGPEFDKKSRLGLTEEEVNDLNKNLHYWIRDFPHYALLNAEDVPMRALALALQQVAINILDTARASTIDKGWLKAGHGEERINLLSREVQLQLASIWVEARDKGEWERFANHVCYILLIIHSVRCQLNFM
jgi:hypothetical protein